MIERFNTKENAKIAMTIANIFVLEMMFLFTLMSGYVPYFFYYSNGYLVFFVLYLILFIIVGRMFDSFDLGETTTTDIFLSYSLTFFVSNVILYIVLCLITLRILPPLPVIVLQLIETFAFALILYSENRYIRANFPPVKVVAIYGEEHYGLIGKLNNVRDLSMSVIRKIDLQDVDYEKLDELLEGADGVVTLDVHHRSEERRVGKECISRWSPYH